MSYKTSTARTDVPSSQHSTQFFVKCQLLAVRRGLGKQNAEGKTSNIIVDIIRGGSEIKDFLSPTTSFRKVRGKTMKPVLEDMFLDLGAAPSISHACDFAGKIASDLCV